MDRHAPILAGKDSDFGAGANLVSAIINGVATPLVGAGQKSGIYWALSAKAGAVVWHTVVGPGGKLGGMEWGLRARNCLPRPPRPSTLLTNGLCRRDKQRA
jgi:hypothetical protein